MKENRLYLTHIAECIERIEEYTAGGREQFMASHLIQDGVLRNFEIIGEAANQLSETMLQRTPDIPWHQITAFRNVLIHGYMAVKLDRVWNVIEDDLQTLKDAVHCLLA